MSSLGRADNALLSWVARATGARAAQRAEHIQSLWSGYGELFRATLVDGPAPSVVVKSIRPPSSQRHPRGWASSRSHERKLRSYEVEKTFYASHAARTHAACRLPACLAATAFADGQAFVLEDLDGAGFGARRASLSPSELRVALRWLAEFHTLFLGDAAEGLWDPGTYWHLATRPDEWDATTDPRLKEAAHALDARLRGARFTTLVHGDAKVANLCFSPDGRDVAAVDFQYVGLGVGAQDVAYFLSSCMSERELNEAAPAALDAYFGFLRDALERSPHRAHARAIEDEWRALYPVAWADFARFLSGWAPEHYKLHGYAERMVREALSELDA